MKLPSRRLRLDADATRQKYPRNGGSFVVRGIAEPRIVRVTTDVSEAGAEHPTRATNGQLVHQIRFSIDELGSTNGHHRFEDLCRQFARSAIAINILPSTGPVSAGGDRGRDFETFRTFIRTALGPHGGFVGATPDGARLAFICTLQKEGLVAKLRSDVEKIAASGPAVQMVYAFTGAALPKGHRDRLVDEVLAAHGFELEVIDGLALAEALATHERFWIAEEFLSIPANLRPAGPDPSLELPDWYVQDRERWRRRQRINPQMGELLDALDGLHHATFHRPSRGDLPFWTGLVEALDRDGVPLAVRQRARYEFAASSIRGIGDMRPADAAALGFLRVAAESETDPVRLGDAVNMLSYAGTAVSFGHSGLAAEQLAELQETLRARVRLMLEAQPPPTRRARLLDVLGRLAALPPATALQRVEATVPDSAALIDQGKEEGIPPEAIASLPSADLGEAMRAWSELAGLLERTPLYPVEGWAEMLDLLRPLLQTQAGWTQIEHAVDEALARQRGGDAAAERARDRALALYEADRPLEALSELHRAVERWWSGDNLGPALHCMLGAADLYQELELPHAAKHYYLAVATGAHGSSDDELAVLVGHAFHQASKLDYRVGAWASAIEYGEVGLLAQSVLTDVEVNPWYSGDLSDLFLTFGMALRCARGFVPEMVPSIERVARRFGFLDALERGLEHAPAMSRAEWTEIADEQLRGRPYSDVGSTRTFHFHALGTQWTIKSSSEYRHARAAERLAAAAQVVLADLANEDLCLLPVELDIDVVATDDDAAGPSRLKPHEDEMWRWTVGLTALRPADAFDERDHFTETLSTLVSIISDVSLLPEPTTLRLVLEAFERGLGARLAAGRPFEELAGAVTERRYAETPRAITPPFGVEGPTPRQHPQLRWRDDPGPTYSRKQADEMLARRYRAVGDAFRPTLTRLGDDPAFVSVRSQLHDRGWLDWHVMLAVANLVGNDRLAQAGLNFSERLRAPEAQARAMELMQAPERPGDRPVPIEQFTAEALDDFRRGALISYARAWDLVLNGSGLVDIAPLERLLASRYRYWTDDVPHEDPFGVV